MGARGKQLADRLSTFNRELMQFVESCSDKGWRQTCAGEQWSVAVVARHMATGHYGIIDLAKGMAAGQGLPEMTPEVVNRMNAEHAQEHNDCSREEVLELLRANGEALASFAAQLDDEQLDRRATLTMIDREVSVEQFLEMVILQSGEGHLKSMRAAAAAQ